jgi:hypothetical protein
MSQRVVPIKAAIYSPPLNERRPFFQTSPWVHPGLSSLSRFVLLVLLVH